MKRERVLLMGNGPTALRSRVGRQVDEFEGLVARCNDAEVEGYQEFVGSRTDIWVTCLADYPFSYDRFNPSVIMASMPYTCNENAQKMWNRYSDETSNTEIEMWDMSWDRWKSVRNQIGHWPSTGSLAAYYFMDRGFDLHIHAFDHFQTDEHHYFDRTGFRRDHNADCEMTFFAKYYYRKHLQIWDQSSSPSSETLPFGVNRFSL